MLLFKYEFIANPYCNKIVLLRFSCTIQFCDAGSSFADVLVTSFLLNIFESGGCVSWSSVKDLCYKSGT